jgi:hypothetical protein
MKESKGDGIFKDNISLKISPNNAGLFIALAR